MPLFVIEYPTTGGGLRTRGEEYKAAQAARKDYRRSLGERIVVAGPKFDDPAADAISSLVILEAADRDEAREIAAADPYYKLGELGDFTVNEIAITNWNAEFRPER